MTGLAHERVHVSARLDRAREDQTRPALFARAEQRDCVRVRRYRRRETPQTLRIAPLENARDDSRRAARNNSSPDAFDNSRLVSRDARHTRTFVRLFDKLTCLRARGQLLRRAQPSLKLFVLLL